MAWRKPDRRTCRQQQPEPGAFGVTRRHALLVLASLADAPRSLFDGVSFKNFRTPTGITSPAVSWRIHDGAIETIPDARRQCDLWTVDEYDNFDLEFEWKLAAGANSGVKYLIQAAATDRLRDAQGEFLHETSLGFEFQLVDDASPASANRPTTHASGALYSYLPPTECAAHAAGQWNTARLLVRGEDIEHWINGRRVLAYSLDSPELKAALHAKRLNSARLLECLARRKTPIAFQHHKSIAAFRAIRVQTLAASGRAARAAAAGSGPGLRSGSTCL